MKPEEAIEVLSNELIVITDMIGYCKDFEKESDLALAYRVKRQEAHNAAISAIKEIQQYREIGTVEECREAVEKQKPKGCNIVKDYFRTYYNCPKCNHNLRVEYNRGSWMGKKSKNCDKCGQAIRWDENLEETENEQIKFGVLL